MVCVRIGYKTDQNCNLFWKSNCLKKSPFSCETGTCIIHAHMLLRKDLHCYFAVFLPKDSSIHKYMNVIVPIFL